MKTSTAHLLRIKRKELDHIVGIARAVVPGLEMVILYGSYARGDYVPFDMREDFGVPTFFASDYDLLMITSKENPSDVQFTCKDKIEQVFYRGRNEWLTPELQIIFETIDEINQQISDRRYFYSDIKREGIMLWDSGKYKLARRRKLNFDEIGQQAQEYYDDKFNWGKGFLDSAYHDCLTEQIKKAAFHLHQATEYLLKTITLVFTLYAPKYHDIKKLRLNARPHVPESAVVFPRNTKAEKDLFDLLRRAYVEARYNPKFVVNKIDIDALIPRIERLRDVAEKACREQLAFYKKMSEQ